MEREGVRRNSVARANVARARRLRPSPASRRPAGRPTHQAQGCLDKDGVILPELAAVDEPLLVRLGARGQRLAEGQTQLPNSRAARHRDGLDRGLAMLGRSPDGQAEHPTRRAGGGRARKGVVGEGYGREGDFSTRRAFSRPSLSHSTSLSLSPGAPQRPTSSLRGIRVGQPSPPFGARPAAPPVHGAAASLPEVGLPRNALSTFFSAPARALSPTQYHAGADPRAHQAGRGRASVA
jgi:hypothetical protein